MSSDSLFKNCKKCGKTISISLAACPHCGEKQKKLTILKWFGIVFFFFIIVSVFNKPNNSNTTTSSLENQKNFEDSLKDGVKKSLILDYTWHKEGFSNIMSADFTISNNSEYKIKDIEINCNHYGESGTRIDSNERKIYEIIDAKAKKSYFNFNMGFIHDQVSTTNCSIKDFAVIK